MASLVLGVVGQALGPSLFGGSVLGGLLSGAQLGGMIGAFAGNMIDGALIGGQTVRRTGPRLTDVNIQASTEGAPMPRVAGRVRVAGQIIWATRFKETVVRSTQNAGGGKGTGGTKVETTEYRYSISLAIGLAQGEVQRLGRVWADGQTFDTSETTIRFYSGTETQEPDALIEEIEGAGNAPGFRGLCYVVIEDLQLASFGNRIPMFQFELFRALGTDNAGALENALRAVTLIPGAGEFVLADEAVTSDDGMGGTVPENVHASNGEADFAASLDELLALAPNLEAVSLIVGWFGDDLRAESIQIKPGVETATKTTYPQIWIVNGVTRASAYVVSQAGSQAAYGGTPSDASVVQAIQALNARGLRVTLCPFLFMDVAAGNSLADPYSDNASASGQPAYPWRGRVTCSPAPGYVASPDRTSVAATQVNAFFGSAASSDFAVIGTNVIWTGGSDWGWRRMVLHYAKLATAAGGVDAFLIGSEFRALTRVRSSATSYPAVAALKTLAADVRAIVGGGCKIGYAADWSEYNNHQTGDAPGAVLFHLDPLWSDSNIDFIGIDNYAPLADWRDGTAHLDYDEAGPTSSHDAQYLAGNIRGGEDYDWYYAGSSARAAQTRTTIADGYGKPWVWRAKDFWGWWANAHYDRADGTESGSSTDWTPESKPIRFMELGCPAVDKGANEPNVFYDPKSSESQLPYFSNGERDDLVQRRFLEAHLGFWADSANNPTSGVYGAPMVDTGNIYVWTWDVRPFPFFPSRADVWGDTANYRLGHWLNGRLGQIQLGDLVDDICASAEFSAEDTAGLSGLVTGYEIDSTMSVRDALEPLALVYHFDGAESEGVLRFRMRGHAPAASFTADDMALPEGDETLGVRFERAQESDLPCVSRISFLEASADYRQSVAEARRLVGQSKRVAESALPIVMDRAQAEGIGARLLQDAWVMREAASFALAPPEIALDPADEVLLEIGGREHRLRLTEIADHGMRAVSAVATDPSIYEAYTGAERESSGGSTALPGRALLVFLDLPLLTGSEVAHAPHVAAFADPWPGSVLVYRSASDSNYAVDTIVRQAALIGELSYNFYSGPAARWDKGNELYVTLYDGSLSSHSDTDTLAGNNSIAIENEDGEWEVLQFAEAELLAPGRWKLTRLLRGQAGTESAMRNPVAAGARVVVLDGGLDQLSLTLNQYALPFYYRWGPNGQDISSAAFQGAQKTFSGVGLRPLSPSHVRARWPTVAGDIDISWIRRTRQGGDSWEQTDVPLAEDAEAYEIDILDGGDVVRTFASAAPQVTYTLAQQTADFGGQQWSVSVAVYQMSATLGRGQGRTATLYY